MKRIFILSFLVLLLLPVVATADDVVNTAPTDTATETTPAEVVPVPRVEEPKPVEASTPAKSSDKSDPSEPVLSRVLFHLIEVLGVVALVFLIWLKRKAITYFEEKMKIDIPVAQEKLISDLAEKAKNFAAEKAHQYRLEHKEKMRGPDKMETGVSWALSLAEEYGLPKLGKDKLRERIEASLGEEREQ